MNDINADKQNERIRSFDEIVKLELMSLQKNIRPSTRLMAVDRQLVRLRKKYVLSDIPDLEPATIAGFLANNRAANAVELTLTDSELSDARGFVLHALEGYTTSEYGDIQCALNLGGLLRKWKFGPGASNGICGTHFYDKIRQPMTCTLKAMPYVRLMRRLDYHLNHFDMIEGCNLTLIEGSKLTTVPKNEETRRTINIEPSGNMALQLAAGAYLEGALRYVGLDIREQQPRNKLLAFVGSLSGRFATIDLKSASDLISQQLVRELMPTDWWAFLSAIRSEKVTLPDGGSRVLHMMSAMGNGFTFPLMTLIICSLMYAMRARLNSCRLNRIDWNRSAVFGDDIIVETEYFEPMCDILARAGLVVNHDKSYSSGPFRESCGGDFYEGHDVTPFYIKSLATHADIYIAINQILLWCSRNSFCLSESIRFLIGELSVERPNLVPEWFQPYNGIRTNSVDRTFKYLSLVPYNVRASDHELMLMAVLGGYLSENGRYTYFTPRTNNLRYKVRKSRLPKGFLDGHDPSYRSRRESAFSDFVLEIAMS